MRTFGKIGDGVLAVVVFWGIAGCSATTPGAVPAAPAIRAAQPEPAKAKATPMLAVAAKGSGSVVVYDAAYKPIETITGFRAGAIYDDHYDQDGNLYVTDEVNSVVDEYAKSHTSPTFQYSTLVRGPIGVATDSNDDVYVANYDEGITEYNQKQNVAIHTCTIPGYSVGVAVGKGGRIFVTFNGFSSGNGGIVEFAHGLSDCKEVTLKASLKGPYTGKLQVDQHGNLIVADQESSAVDVIAPPYSSITRKISGFPLPFGVALNKTDTLLYVACDRGVRVVSYPKGTLVEKLRGQEIVKPVGVAGYP
jgi:hypothetical protein